MSTSTVSNVSSDNAKLPVVYFTPGIPEEISRISLKRDKRLNNQKVVTFIFAENSASTPIHTMEGWGEFVHSIDAMHLVDSEGEITVYPEDVAVSHVVDGFRTSEVAISFHVTEDNWSRVMRFLGCYATSQGMAYTETSN